MADRVALVTGSHTLGGYRIFFSADIADCPFEPFDCTPGKQFGAKPFDNNVYKVRPPPPTPLPPPSPPLLLRAAAAAGGASLPVCSLPQISNII